MAVQICLLHQPKSMRPGPDPGSHGWGPTPLSVTAAVSKDIRTRGVVGSCPTGVSGTTRETGVHPLNLSSFSKIDYRGTARLPNHSSCYLPPKPFSFCLAAPFSIFLERLSLIAPLGTMTPDSFIPSQRTRRDLIGGVPLPGMKSLMLTSWIQRDKEHQHSSGNILQPSSCFPQGWHPMYP